MQARHGTMHGDRLPPIVRCLDSTEFVRRLLSFAPPALFSPPHSWRFTYPPPPSSQPFLFSACTVWCNEFAQVAWLESKSRSSLGERRVRGERIKRPMVNTASRATRKNRPRNMNKFLVRELRRVCSNAVLERGWFSSSRRRTGEWIVRFLRDHVINGNEATFSNWKYLLIYGIRHSVAPTVSI